MPLQAHYGRELGTYIGENRCGNGAGVADWPSDGVDTAHVTGQDLPGNGQSWRQHDAGAERANARRNRTDEGKLGRPSESRGESHQGGAPAALFAADAGIE